MSDDDDEYTGSTDLNDEGGGFGLLAVLCLVVVAGWGGFTLLSLASVGPDPFSVTKGIGQLTAKSEVFTKQEDLDWVKTEGPFVVHERELVYAPEGTDASMTAKGRLEQGVFHLSPNGLIQFQRVEDGQVSIDVIAGKLDTTAKTLVVTAHEAEYSVTLLVPGTSGKLLPLAPLPALPQVAPVAPVVVAPVVASAPVVTPAAVVKPAPIVVRPAVPPVAAPMPAPAPIAVAPPPPAPAPAPAAPVAQALPVRSVPSAKLVLPPPPSFSFLPKEKEAAPVVEPVVAKRSATVDKIDDNPNAVTNALEKMQREVTDDTRPTFLASPLLPIDSLDHYAIELLSPAEKVTTGADWVSFEWSAVPVDGVRFEVLLAHDSTFKDALRFESKENRASLQALEKGDYVWRIRAFRNKEEIFSPLHHFKLK